MVLFDPMGDQMLQLVISHPATNKTLFPRRAPPWAGDASKLSNAQLESCAAFGNFAINNLRGVTGTQEMNGNQVSTAAVRVAEDYPHKGEGSFGGLSEEERRQERYNQAEANVDSLERELEARGISSSGMLSGARTDGGQRRDAAPRNQGE